jgi:hypothetical protein
MAARIRCFSVNPAWPTPRQPRDPAESSAHTRLQAGCGCARSPRAFAHDAPGPREKCDAILGHRHLAYRSLQQPRAQYAFQFGQPLADQGFERAPSRRAALLIDCASASATTP